MKRYLDINIPYWFGKQLNIILWENENGKEKRLLLTFWLNYKVKDLPQYKDEWFLGKRKSFVLRKCIK